MKFEILTVNNFRQFYNDQSIHFSKDKKNNITVIHGENGSGKTALLNCFYWLFYDQIYLPNSKKIVNERSIAEANVGDTIKVEATLKFEHDENIYTAYRKKEFEKKNEDDFTGQLVNEDFSLEYVDTAGKSIERTNPKNAIKQILPEDISKLFFFHGEYINELSKEEQSDEIQKDIKIIMGLEILERAIRHLETVGKRFENEMKKIGDKDLVDLIEQKEKKEEELEKVQKEYDTIKENIKGLKKEIDAVDEKLKKIQGSRELQERRERLEGLLEEKKESILDIEKRLKEVCSEKSYYIHLSPIINKANDVLEEKMGSGKLPTYIKKQFVDELIERNKCICGRELKDDPNVFKEIKKWKERAGLEGVDEAAFVLKNRINEFPDKKEKFMESIRNLLQKKMKLIDDKRNINGELDEISSDLESIDLGEIKNLEEKRKSLKENIDHENQNIGIKKKGIEELKDEIKELSDKEGKMKVKEEKALLAQKRFIACNKAKEYIEKLYEKFAKQVREEVQEKVGDLHSEFIHKAYWAEITEDYRLKIYKKIGDKDKSVGMSTGERQIASLAFIGGLAKIARERYLKKKDAVYFKGGIYPIIMDSPFGYLDEKHKERIAEGMPNLAEQLVVLVTSSQWKGEVERAMRAKSGKVYRLEYNNPKEEHNDYEYTVIGEV